MFFDAIKLSIKYTFYTIRQMQFLIYRLISLFNMRTRLYKVKRKARCAREKKITTQSRYEDTKTKWLIFLWLCCSVWLWQCQISAFRFLFHLIMKRTREISIAYRNEHISGVLVSRPGFDVMNFCQASKRIDRF